MAQNSTPADASTPPDQAWFQPLGWWRDRGASNNALRLATGLEPVGASCDIDQAGYTLWHYWAEGHEAHRHFDLMAAVPALTHKSYLHGCADDGEHPWHRLMLRGQLKAAQAWTRKFGFPDMAMTNQHGDDMLMAACWSGNDELACWLIEHDADTSKADHGGLTALMVAIHRCGQETALALVRAGADPGAVDRQQKNALHHAAALGLVDIFPVLEDAGADAEVRDASGLTAQAALARTLRTESANIEAARTHWLRRYQARLAF